MLVSSYARTGEMGKVEVFCCGEDCEWRDEHWFHEYVVAVAVGGC